MEQDINTEAAAGRVSARSSSRTRSVVMVGLVVAITAVCAWVTIPLGPVPFTLQMFAITFAICTLTPAQATAAIYAYVALGAIGLPLFSGMRGGLGVLAGPTGGFLLGYLIGVPLAALFLYVVKRLRGKDQTSIVSGIAAGIIFTICAYIVGCIQYMFITGLPLEAAIATCVLPFVLTDIIKIAVAAVCANRVSAALAK